MDAEGYTFKPFKYSSHYWVLKMLSDEKRALSILDVGTSTGYLGRILKQNGHCVVGVENHGAWAEAAKPHYDRFYEADIERFEFPFRKEFDCVLFADVLEHVRDPTAVVRRALPALKKTGHVIVSVPNIANIVIRLSLLIGRFDYMERGILDRSHLRFFTLRSSRALLQGVGCQIIEITAAPLPIQLVFPVTERGIFIPFHEAHYSLVRIWKTMFAYQFVLKARPGLSPRVS